MAPWELISMWRRIIQFERRATGTTKPFEEKTLSKSSFAFKNVPFCLARTESDGSDKEAKMDTT